ncbi:MAG: BMP family ABC transporter substrate-binding protein [Oscillospiraceae bacterium]|nr:BMP family ABC transporter substrate-binding protein [Oscillospiraceae bacterium]
MARQDYIAAKKLGDSWVRFCEKRGLSPYPPVLDSFEGLKDSAGEVRLGLLELPVSRIKGNKEMGRNNAFASNFMPILGSTTEFGLKWASLYDSYANEGIRDAILVYEYMNQYYVQEGNKRVSVSKYGGSEFILADVIRILPKRDDSKESRLYYEYLDFYKSTKNVYIVFSEPGEYQKLADLLGETLGDKWPEDLCKDLKAAFFNFCRKSGLTMDDDDDFTMSDAFLIYISIFPLKSLLTDSKDQIVKNIRLARRELMTSTSVEKIDFVESAPETGEQKSGILSLFTPSAKYTKASPLRVAFLYDTDIESSRWINSHEAGRLYVDEVTGDNVRTAFYTIDADLDDAVERAARDRNELIFVVTPDRMNAVLQAAVKYPYIRFFTCAVGEPHALVRSYHGKLYEAAFLMGIYCGSLTLAQGSGQPHRVGYIARTFDNTSVVNAFAVGVSMMDPACRIMLSCVKPDAAQDLSELRAGWIQAGASYYADFEYPLSGGNTTRPGLYSIGAEKDTYLGRPYYNWGKYYAQIIQAVLSGAWNAADLVNEQIVKNYWFGLSTEVVDISVPQIPYQTKKMLAFFKNSIANGGFDPFVGELHAQDGIIQNSGEASRSGFNLDFEKLASGKIATMDWLCDNIDGQFITP